jgi:hypothetical protein
MEAGGPKQLGANRAPARSAALSARARQLTPQATERGQGQMTQARVPAARSRARPAEQWLDAPLLEMPVAREAVLVRRSPRPSTAPVRAATREVRPDAIRVQRSSTSEVRPAASRVRPSTREVRPAATPVRSETDQRRSAARAGRSAVDLDPPQRPRPTPVGRAPGGVPGRQTVVITGRGAERYVAPQSARRRPQRPAHERPGFRPDRAALYAVLLGALLILVAASSSHASVRAATRAAAQPRAALRAATYAPPTRP